LAIRESPSHIGNMNLGLLDGQTAALTRELHDIVENDRDPFLAPRPNSASPRAAPHSAAVTTGSGSFSRDQATTRSACSTLPLVSGASTSERAKLSAPTQVPIIIGIA
jgi:hypothetical protein